MAYSDSDRALIIAAVERYGETTGLRFVKDNYELTPSRGTVHEWVRVQGIEPSEEAREELSRIEQGRKATWQAALDATRDSLIGATQKAADDGNALAAQQFATATGIFYDKLVPPARAGAPVIGNAEKVEMVLLAPAFSPVEPPPESSEVIEGESREAEPEQR